VGAETANTSIDVLRGTTTNWAGDTVDAAVAVIENLPVTLAETGKTVQDPSSATPRTIRQVICIAPEYAGILNTDRIRDRQTGDIYIVLATTRPPTTIGAPTDRVLDLKRVSSSGT
jgi:hypothetical protein